MHKAHKNVYISVTPQYEDELKMIEYHLQQIYNGNFPMTNCGEARRRIKKLLGQTIGDDF